MKGRKLTTIALPGALDKDEESALVRDQYETGRDHGHAIADILLDAFPFRATRYVRRKVRATIHQSFSSVQNTLLANGIEARFRQPVAAGFIAGLKDRDPELSTYVDQRHISLG